LLKSPNKLYKIKKMRDTIQSQTVFWIISRKINE
jgi:hypothetical protein